MLKSIDASLKRLQTDYIDGYLMHWDDRVGTPIEETIACMKELKNAGRWRFLGISNLELRPGRPPAGGRRSGYCSVSLQYDQPHQGGCSEVLCRPGMRHNGLWLSGRRHPHRPVPGGTHLWPRGYALPLSTAPCSSEPGFSQIQALLKVMDGIAETHKATVAQVAINWALAHDYMHTVLTGVGNAAEAEENCAAAAWELTVQEKQELDEAISKIHIYS